MPSPRAGRLTFRSPTATSCGCRLPRPASCPGVFGRSPNRWSISTAACRSSRAKVGSVATTDRVPSTELLTAARAQLPPPGAHMVDTEFSEVPARHLREYLWVLYKYRWLALTCFGLTLGLTAMMTLLTPRLYTATTRLLIENQSPIQLQLKENVLRVEDADRNVNGPSSFLGTQVAALRSRDVAERVIRGERLAENEAFLRPRPERQGFLSLSAGLLSLLRPRGWVSGPPSSEGEGGASEPARPALL